MTALAIGAKGHDGASQKTFLRLAHNGGSGSLRQGPQQSIPENVSDLVVYLAPVVPLHVVRTEKRVISETVSEIVLVPSCIDPDSVCISSPLKHAAFQKAFLRFM